MKVFLVTYQTTYGRQIAGVFSTNPLASKYIKEHPLNDGYEPIMELSLNQEIEGDDLWVYTLCLDKKGNSLRDCEVREAARYDKEFFQPLWAVIYSYVRKELYCEITVMDNSLGGAMYQGKLKVDELVASGKWVIEE
jgi:hypothetical protein